MVKISALYFLNYPDRLPENPDIASSEMRVEVGAGNPTVAAFDQCHAFTVYTLGFLEKELQTGKKPYLIDNSVIIVTRFDVAVIRQAVESILNDIDRYGVKIG
jgi:hypothetical protein